MTPIMISLIHPLLSTVNNIMVDKVVVMKIMILNKLDPTLKSTRFLDSKVDSVIIVLSISKDSGVNMLAHQIKPILLKSQTLLMKWSILSIQVRTSPYKKSNLLLKPKQHVIFTTVVKETLLLHQSALWAHPLDLLHFKDITPSNKPYNISK